MNFQEIMDRMLEDEREARELRELNKERREKFNKRFDKKQLEFDRRKAKRDKIFEDIRTSK